MKWFVADSYKNYNYDETKAYEVNNKLYVRATCKCDRCGGRGYYVIGVCNNKPVLSPLDGGVCYECNGTGIDSKEIRLYSEKEYLQMKRNKERASEKREKEREARMKAEYANKKAKWLKENGFTEYEDGLIQTYVVIGGNTFTIKDELKQLGCIFNPTLKWHCAEPVDVPAGYGMVGITLDEVAELSAWGDGYYKPEAAEYIQKIIDDSIPREKSASEWLGDKGERLRDLDAEVLHIHNFEGAFGLTTVYTFNVDGNICVWFTSSNQDLNEGDIVSLTGTVKDHKSYQGIAQTYLSRCKVSRV